MGRDDVCENKRCMKMMGRGTPERSSSCFDLCNRGGRVFHHVATRSNIIMDGDI